jgi:hypothetical protein
MGVQDIPFRRRGIFARPAIHDLKAKRRAAHLNPNSGEYTIHVRTQYNVGLRNLIVTVKPEYFYIGAVE